MRIYVLLSLTLLVITLSPLAGCDDKAKKGDEASVIDVVDDGGGRLSKLDATQERRVTDMDKSGPLLNAGLAGALIGLPKDHAERVVKLAYAKASVSKDNPRVNKTFKVSGAAELESIDVRWSRTNKRLVGSVVFTYGKGVEVAKLGELVKAVAKPIEGEKERWKVEGDRMTLSYFPSNMTGQTVVAFEPAELEGDPIGGGEMTDKQKEEWGLQGRQREKRLKAAAPRADEYASGRNRDREGADDAKPGEADTPPPAADPLKGLDGI